MLTRYARYVSSALGEQVLAELREDFVSEHARAAGRRRSSAPAPATCSPAPLATSTQLGWSVRWALPETMIALVTAVVTIVAALLVGPWVLRSRACSACRCS